MNNIEISEFDFAQIKAYSTMVFVAPRRAGKSTFIIELLYRHFIRKRKIKNYLIISPTAFNPDYQFIDDKFKSTELTEEVLENILEIQKEKISRDPKADNEMVIVLDDIMKSTNGKTKDMLERIFILGRHYALNILLSVQNIRAEYSVSMRMNSDYIVVYQSTNKNNKKEVSELWLSLGDKDMENAGYNLIGEVPKKYRTMVIDNTSVIKEKFADFVYYFEASLDVIPRNYNFSG